MDEFSFASKEELYNRIKPALRAKTAELHRLGYSYIQEVDIWNYLSRCKWLTARNLKLSDIVNDVLHVENEQIDIFLKGEIAKDKRRAYLHQKLEIL